MTLIKKVKRKLGRCDDCWKRAEFHFEMPDIYEKKEEVDHYYYCYDHAETSGFCMGCGGFWGGVESFDCSKVKGYCEICVDELDQDLGIGEDYGDFDYYDDYAHDFSEKQPQEVMTSNVSKTTEEGN